MGPILRNVGIKLINDIRVFCLGTKLFRVTILNRLARLMLVRDELAVRIDHRKAHTRAHDFDAYRYVGQLRQQDARNARRKVAKNRQTKHESA